MDNQENQAAPESPVPATGNAPKKNKPAKMSLESFLASWRDALASEEDPVPRLRKLVRAGFAGEVTGEQVALLVASLSERSTVAERLGLPLAVQDRFGKLGALARRFLTELRTSFETGIRYDPQEFSGYRAPCAIEEWIADHAPSTPPAERDSWFRRFAVCLLKDSDPKTVLFGLVAASRRWASSKGLKTSAEGAKFVRAMAGALSQLAIAAGKLELILTGVAAVEEQSRQMLNCELDLKRQISAHRENIDGLNRRVAVLEGQLAGERADGAEKAARIAALEHSLMEAEERYNLLDRHWRGVSEQELTKQSGTFRERVSQELVEALLALDRENPNLEMALRRLRRIQDILSK